MLNTHFGPNINKRKHSKSAKY